MRIEGERRRWSRRRFLSSTFLGFSSATWLAACRSSSQKEVGSRATATPATAQPRRGGTLTWAQWDSNEDIDPAVPSGASATEVIGNVLDTLVAVDADERVYPALASRWTVSDDARTYVFTLRDDVIFHDGSTLDATAVKGTFERILDPRTKAAGNASLLGPVEALEAPDMRTFVLRLKAPMPLLPLVLWRPWFGVLSPKQLAALKPGDRVTAPVGSGPFRFVDRSPDGVITLEAFPRYAWGPTVLQNRGAPFLDRIKFRSVPEAATRVATLESGESLLIDDLAEPDYARLKADKRFSFVKTPRLGLAIGFFINVERPPTNDRAVREALNWAVDRKAIVEKLFFGVHRVTVGPLTEGVWGRLDELEQRFSYDPKRATQILEGAGWHVGTSGVREKDGERLTLVLATYLSPWSELADVLQAQYRQVGVDLQVQKMARGPYLDFVRDYRHHLAQSAGTNFDPDELRVRYHSAGIKLTNFSNLKDAQLDDLLTKGSLQPLGSDERRKTYEEAQRRLMDLLPFVSIMTQVRVEAMAARLHGLRMGPHGLNAQPLTGVWLEV